MPKAILQYDIDEPFERNAFKRASNSTNAYLAHFEFDQFLRGLEKYDHYQQFFSGDPLSARDHEVAQIIISEIRSKFYNNLGDYQVDLNDLE